MAKRTWNIKGDDGKAYKVEERPTPGAVFRPLSGSRQVMPGGVEYVLADGRDLLDETPGHWEVLGSGVLLPHPADL